MLKGPRAANAVAADGRPRLDGVIGWSRIRAAGASGMLARDYKGKEADRLVTRIDPGVVSRVAALRGHERQAAEELGQ